MNSTEGPGTTSTAAVAAMKIVRSGGVGHRATRMLGDDRAADHPEMPLPPPLIRAAKS